MNFTNWQCFWWVGREVRSCVQSSCLWPFWLKYESARNLKDGFALLWLAQRASACEMGCSGQACDAGSKAKTVASGAAVLATTCWQWADGSKCPHQLWGTRHLCVW